MERSVGLPPRVAGCPTHPTETGIGQANPLSGGPQIEGQPYEEKPTKWHHAPLLWVDMWVF